MYLDNLATYCALSKDVEGIELLLKRMYTDASHLPIVSDFKKLPSQVTRDQFISDAGCEIAGDLYDYIKSLSPLKSDIKADEGIREELERIFKDYNVEAVYSTVPDVSLSSEPNTQLFLISEDQYNIDMIARVTKAYKFKTPVPTNGFFAIVTKEEYKQGTLIYDKGNWRI